MGSPFIASETRSHHKEERDVELAGEGVAAGPHLPRTIFLWEASPILTDQNLIGFWSPLPPLDGEPCGSLPPPPPPTTLNANHITIKILGLSLHSRNSSFSYSQFL